MENNNLSMGQKTLLESHYCFGHLGLQQVQFVLRHFILPHEKFLLLQNSIFLCARFVNLPRPVVAPSMHDVSLKSGVLRTSELLVYIYLLIMALVSCMLSIRLGFLLLRLLDLSRIMKVCVWNMGILYRNI